MRNRPESVGGPTPYGVGASVPNSPAHRNFLEEAGELPQRSSLDGTGICVLAPNRCCWWSDAVRVGCWSQWSQARQAVLEKLASFHQDQPGWDWVIIAPRIRWWSDAIADLGVELALSSSTVLEKLSFRKESQPGWDWSCHFNCW
jgi:hypothetical protein